MRHLAICMAAVSTAAVLLGAAFVPTAWATGSAPSPVSYRPPVDAPVVDPFRPPAQPWLAGNRGVDYATSSGDEVGAAAAGEVVFAGNVGGSQHVVVLHGDGVRTSYSFLDTVAVHRGDLVTPGQVVGNARGVLHFGARIGEAYLDPTLLFGDGSARVHLVPVADRPRSESEERSRVLGMLGRFFGGAVDALDSGIDQVEGVTHYLSQTYPLRLTAKGVTVLKQWWDQRGDCTQPDTEPPKLPERRLLVLVAGLGSKSDKAAVFNVKPTALGYLEADVVKFSYRGGDAKNNPYGPEDTVVDIRLSARRLRELLVDLAAANPGVPVDIVAHSQGGLVARWALTEEFDGLDHRLPRVATFVTLGTPHNGADLATLSAMIGHTLPGKVVQQGAAPFVGFDPGSTSVEQLAETSEFIRRLNERPLPKGIAITSIGARGDLVVPAPRTRVDGAHNVVVSVEGGVLDVVDDHDRLPPSGPAQREIALAVGGLPPTCQGFFDAFLDAGVSEGISLIEDSAGLAAWAGAQSLDPTRLVPVLNPVP